MQKILPISYWWTNYLKRSERQRRRYYRERSERLRRRYWSLNCLEQRERLIRIYSCISLIERSECLKRRYSFFSFFERSESFEIRRWDPLDLKWNIILGTSEKLQLSHCGNKVCVLGSLGLWWPRTWSLMEPTWSVSIKVAHFAPWPSQRQIFHPAWWKQTRQEMDLGRE